MPLWRMWINFAVGIHGSTREISPEIEKTTVSLENPKNIERRIGTVDLYNGLIKGL